ncbi:MAG: asparagine synthase (glutamine-hydrolyzing) [Gemmatimonadaceae bacterium]
MCGISGVLSTHAPPLRLDDELHRHRGPDDAGTYHDPRGTARLSFRRLSILDLSAAGHQPMSNEDGTVWLIFNGEIYNYRPLRASLQARGHRFRSRTDCEVLIHLWEEHGRSMLGHLNGMFAFCLWDQAKREAFLARDHAGIKPLYLADVPGGIAFASEAKVLLALPSLQRQVDTIALQQYLTFLWVPGARTMWSGIRKLEPGTWLSWTPERTETGVWWDWDQSQKDDRSPESWVGALRTTLVESVDRQLMSDVPLGALVSGGLDSSAIAGAMRNVNPESTIRAYTARLGGGRGAEGKSRDGFEEDLPYAREVAARLGLELVEADVNPAIASLLPLLVWHTDEPLADPAIAASYLLCKRAREDGTIVLLSGQGADELYHGYRSHEAVRLASRLAGVPAPLVRAASAIAESAIRGSGASRRAAPRRVAKMLRFLGANNADRILQLADWGSASVRAGLFSPAVSAVPSETVYADYLDLFAKSRATTDEERWSYVLFKTFMPSLNLTYGDRTSMAVSVELRVPYLDRALVEQAGRMPLGVKQRQGRQKWVLGEAARGWLPESVLARPKTGFGAPLREWLASGGPLHTQMRSTLLGDRFLERGLFLPEGVSSLLEDLRTGRRDVSYIVWALFTFEIWARTFVDELGLTPRTLAA